MIWQPGAINPNDIKPFRDMYAKEKFSDVNWENEVTPIPREFVAYYLDHYEEYKNIPMDKKTARKIAKILDEEGIKP